MKVDWYDLDLRRLNMTALPCSDNHNLLYFDLARPDDPIHREPIVAWRVGLTNARAVTVNPMRVCGFDDVEAVEFPDGRVQCDDELYPNAAAFAAAVNRPMPDVPRIGRRGHGLMKDQSTPH